MKFNVPSVIHEQPQKDEWKSRYPDNRFQAKLAYLSAGKVYIRNRLAEAQNWHCCWCGVLTVPEPNQKNSATIEHVTPRCQGGEDHPDNYAMSCYNCNIKRGTKAADLFQEIVDGRRVIESELDKRERFRQRRIASNQRQEAVLDVLRQGLPNQFPEHSKEAKMYERYVRSVHPLAQIAAVSA